MAKQQKKEMGSWINLVCGAFFLSVMNHQAIAKERTFFIKGDYQANVTVDLPKNWQSAENYYGAPLMLFGPINKNLTVPTRPVVEIVPPVGIMRTAKPVMDPKKVDAAERNLASANFKKSKEKWLKELGFSNYSFTGVTPLEIKGQGPFMQATVDFKRGDDVMMYERTLYGYVNGQLVHIKVLMPKADRESYDDTISEILSSLKLAKN